ncbi:MAG TPA: DUF6174 domain-containing protein [Spirochaetota bacterium]|nr:DUF6174 domain-containing protein [Spirochaetota bacterium]
MRLDIKNIICASLILTYPLQSFGEESLEGKFERSYSKWKKDRITHYLIKTNYSAFTPLSGLWEIEFGNGKVLSARLNSEKNTNPNIAFRFTMDGLYQMVEKIYAKGKSAKKTILVEYDKKNGYIKRVSGIVEEFSMNPPKKDIGFSIEVIEFRSYKK